MGTRGNEKYKTAVALEIENLELQATVESQEEMLNRMKEDMKNYGHFQDRRSEILALDRDQELMDLKEELQTRDLTLQQYRDELIGSQNALEDVYKKYEQLRQQRESHENQIRKNKQELKNLQDTLEGAQREKLQIADKLRQVQNERAAIKLDFDWLREKLRNYEDQGEEQTDGFEEEDSGYFSKRESFSRSTGRRVSKTENSRTVDGETTQHATVVDEFFAVNDDQSMQPVVDQFRKVEDSFKKSVSASNRDLQRDKDELMKEFKTLQMQLYDLQREHEKYAREVTEKDELIQRLKDAKEVLVNDMDSLTLEVQQLRSHNDKIQAENADLQSKLLNSRNEMSKLEVQFESAIKQKNYLKEQLEGISTTSMKGKEDYSRLESQLRDYQRKIDSMNREVSNKDAVNQQLKTKVSTLEGKFSFLSIILICEPQTFSRNLLEETTASTS